MHLAKGTSAAAKAGAMVLTANTGPPTGLFKEKIISSEE
jgi:hypothetical protein